RRPKDRLLRRRRDLPPEGASLFNPYFSRRSVAAHRLLHRRPSWPRRRSTAEFGEERDGGVTSMSLSDAVKRFRQDQATQLILTGLLIGALSGFAAVLYRWLIAY